MTTGKPVLEPIKESKSNLEMGINQDNQQPTREELINRLLLAVVDAPYDLLLSACILLE